MDSKEHTARISVVIPAYNAEKFLPSCLDSVLSQTHLPHEIIVIDDGSSDNTLKIAKKYALRHSTLIRVLQHANGMNKGASASRNLGISHTQGTYVAFLDADDEWLSNKLEMQATTIARHPAVLLFNAKAALIDEDGAPTTLHGVSTCGRGTPGIQSSPFLQILHENTIINSTCVVRKDALIKAGCFSRDIYSYEDWLLWLKIATFGSFYFDESVLASYRRHSEGKLLAAQNNRVGPQREVDLLAKLYEYLDQMYPDNMQEHLNHLRYSIRRVLLRARSLSYSKPEMSSVRDALVHHFPRLQQQTNQFYRILMLLPASFFSMLRKVRRYIVKV